MRACDHVQASRYRQALQEAVIGPLRQETRSTDAWPNARGWPSLKPEPLNVRNGVVRHRDEARGSCGQTNARISFQAQTLLDPRHRNGEMCMLPTPHVILDRILTHGQNREVSTSARFDIRMWSTEDGSMVCTGTNQFHVGIESLAMKHHRSLRVMLFMARIARKCLGAFSTGTCYGSCRSL